MTTVLVLNAWPDALPLPYTDYAAESRNTTLVSAANSGRIMRRARSRKTYGKLSATWNLGTTEKRAFETFYETTLGCGVACFSMDLRLSQGTALTNWVVRFGDGGYTVQYNEGVWQITAPLDLIIPSLLPDGAVDPQVGFDTLFLRTADSFVEETLLDVDGELFMVVP